ncbi:MAG: precorrin-8X methylmutase [Azospirillaceae bacterium]|nr:precorrin-8X methylmutase [Azospirillaceae bacterium]
MIGPYLHDPAAIYRQSFAVIRDEAVLDGLSEAEITVALRVAHACGMVDVTAALRFHPDAVVRARDALRAGAPILADCTMVTAGIIRNRLPADNRVLCTLDHPALRDPAVAPTTTRSAAAVELWRPDLDQAVVVIGNAPTALFRLLELLEAGAPTPAAILAFPVGFVGAAESKDTLIRLAPVPYITLPGRRGGSAMAAAALNALAGLTVPPVGGATTDAAAS